MSAAMTAPMLNRGKCALPSSNAGTTRIVKEYVKRVASHDLEEYPEWNLKASLPKLPVPSLEHTLSMYLKVLRPITSDEQYENAQKLVKDFQVEGGEGETLQKRLIEFANSTDNWAYKWWLDDMYLLNRSPLPINSNPGMVFPKTTFSDSNEQLRFAARLISGILDYKFIIDARGLPTDRARHREKGQPLCMEQYYRLFSTYREPGEFKDRLSTITMEPGKEHITVVRHNMIFRLDVTNNVMRLSEDDICCQLKRICRIADERSSEADQAVGILTALSRNEWAACRDRLLTDPTNAKSLNSIETSIFILCLDKSVPVNYNHIRSVDETDHKQRDDNSLALQMLHGQGTQLNSRNRWYDKTMQFIIGEDGACGLNYEHSPSEGIAVVQLIEHVLRYMEELRKRKLVRMNSIVELPYPSKLEWKLCPQSLSSIVTAGEKMNEAISNLDFYLLRFNGYGKEFPKSQNMSPDCLIQLALQLTHYRIHGNLVSTYESASTRRYRLGRVDNIRSASCEALDWCKAMQGEVVCNPEQKMALLREAIKAQNEYMVETILGHGMDCHMLALKCIAEQNNSDAPELFKDITWSLCNTFTLSTSQVVTTLDSFMGYGPVVPDGYGASYNPHANSIIFCISSFKACPNTRSDVFAMTLENVMCEIQQLCMEVSSKRNLEPIKEQVENGILNISSNGITSLAELTINMKETPENMTRNSSKSSPRRLVRQKEATQMLNGSGLELIS
ncbi:choline O-acetyltransferase-like [Watersipora subatra]|uniref:choline O-acetyltransferase-like n=1 Tax=Watersipora subatra TaxID=2589382 RepID=UPI00355BB08B